MRIGSLSQGKFAVQGTELSQVAVLLQVNSFRCQCCGHSADEEFRSRDSLCSPSSSERYLRACSKATRTHTAHDPIWLRSEWSQLLSHWGKTLLQNSRCLGQLVIVLFVNSYLSISRNIIWVDNSMSCNAPGLFISPTHNHQLSIAQFCSKGAQLMEM